MSVNDIIEAADNERESEGESAFLSKEDFVAKGGNPEKWVSEEDFAKGKRASDLYEAKKEAMRLRKTIEHMKRGNQAREEDMRKRYAAMADTQIRIVASRYEDRIAALEEKQEEAEEEEDFEKYKKLEKKKKELVAKQREEEKKIKEESEKKADRKAAADPEEVEAMEEWTASKDWWQKDEDKTALAVAVAKDLDKQYPGLSAKVFLKKLDVRLKKEFVDLGLEKDEREEDDDDEREERPRPYRMPGGRAGGGGGAKGVSRAGREIGEAFIKDHPAIFKNADGKPNEEAIKKYWDDMREAEKAAARD